MNVTVKDMMPARNFYPTIDYRTHPAFRNLNTVPYSHDEKVYGLISAIDAEVERIKSNKFGSAAEIDRAFEEAVVARILALKTFLAETIDDQRVVEWLARAFSRVTRELHDLSHVASLQDKAVGLHGNTPAGAAVARNLEKDGVHICRLDRDTHNKLLSLCAPFMHELRERSKTPSNDRIVRNFELYSAVGTQLAGFFQREGVLDGLSAYVGSNVNFSGFSLEYSCARQNWWRGVYSDVGLADTKATYMHYDQGCRDPKAIIALTDVTEENGPTGFVCGSHKQDRSIFLHFMITALDHCFVADREGQAVEFNYRPRFTSEKFRREMLMLPTALHGSSHFGDDVLDETELSKELLRNEIRMTKDVGNCIVFDGNYGIHRGGLVKSGERFVFQVIFDIRQKPGFLQRAKSKSRWLALKVLKGVR